MKSVSHEASEIPPEDYRVTEKDRGNALEYQRVCEAAQALAREAPPMPAEVWTKVAQILAVPAPPSSLMRWKVRLSCGHMAEVIRHISYERPNMAGSVSGHCDTCDSRSLIVAWRPLGPVEVIKSPVLDYQIREVRKQQLKKRIEKLEKELAELEGEADASVA